jgi:hypothetical protein
MDYKNYIVIGNINKQLLFISKYILRYKSSMIIKSEKNHLINNPIENYLKYRHCNLLSPKKNQLLISNEIHENEEIVENREIGELYIIGNNNPNVYNIIPSFRQNNLYHSINNNKANQFPNIRLNKTFEQQRPKAIAKKLIFDNKPLILKPNDNNDTVLIYNNNLDNYFTNSSPKYSSNLSNLQNEINIMKQNKDIIDNSESELNNYSTNPISNNYNY